MKKVLLTIFVIGSLSLQADPVEITITGATDPANNGEWLVDTIFGTFLDNSALLESQVWVGDFELATLFSLAVGGTLGFTQPFGAFLGDVGPAFGWLFQGPPSNLVNVLVFCAPPANPLICPHLDTIVGVGFGAGGSLTTVFAVAGRPPVSSIPEPATLGLFSLGLAGLGFARRRRQA